MESRIYYTSNPLFLKYFGSRYEMRRKLLAIVLGNLLFSLGVNIFYTGHRFLSGGIGGISIMIQYLTGISAGIMVFLLNIPLFIFGLKELNKKFLTYAFISIIVQSLSMIVFRDIRRFLFLEDPMLSAVIGAVIVGSSMGILFKNGCCQGGFDIVAAVMKKKYNMQIGNALLSLNGIVICIASILFGPAKGAYTIIAMFISYKVLDRIQMGVGDTKSAIIISHRASDIAKAITMGMSRGVTVIEGKGGWSGAPTEVLYMVLRTREISKVKEIISNIDGEAFIGISDIVEVRGRGFRRGDIA
ncbi:MAG: YitT family protein [Tissierellia bacterium]|nr:YitT family protein [Tissierellia bacterium]